jgi:nucleotidyltransferase/DNA polymerase involved in DNA repair
LEATLQTRVILHLDMDAFYAAVEVRDDPALAGKPLIIGHRGPRGVVSTCSYEARRFGVRSALPSVRAERLCPDAVWLPGRMGVYVQVSREIKRVLRDFTPLVESISIDEAFLDLAGIARDLDGGLRIARQIKERILSEQRLTASVGVAPNKFLAKLASDMEKPDGLVVLPLAAIPDRLWPLPVDRLWGVGPKTAARLREGGFTTVHDIVTHPAERLEELVGASLASHLRALARGEDDRPVVTEHEAKSISQERTYRTDLTDSDAIDKALLERAEGVSSDLRRAGLVGRTVNIKVRTGDFTTWTRSLTLSHPSDRTDVIVAIARRLFRERIRLGGKGVRLLGVGMSGLEPAGAGGGPEQMSLFPDREQERHRSFERAADSLRERLGRDAVVRARLLRTRRTGSDGEEGEPPEEASSLPAVD